MNAEYQRLKDQARQCWEALESVAESTTVNSPMDAAETEDRLLEMGIRMASLAFGMVLVRSVADEQARDRDQKFVESLPKKFHSQGKRPVSVSLRAGVKVSLSVRYYHRLKDPGRSRRKNRRRGLYATRGSNWPGAGKALRRISGPRPPAGKWSPFGGTRIGQPHVTVSGTHPLNPGKTHRDRPLAVRVQRGRSI